MDTFFYQLQGLAEIILPILGVVALILVIIILLRVVKMLDALTLTINKTHGSIELVEKTLDKVQSPVDTMVKVSKTVDNVHDASVKAAGEAKETIIKNVKLAKEKVGKYINKENSEEKE